jgi:hypothetical protein
VKIRTFRQAKNYLESVGLLEILLQYQSNSDNNIHSVIEPVSLSEPISIDFIDLARLHILVVSRKCLNVLELGSGFSSLVIAHAIRMNSNEYMGVLPASLRRQNPWHLDSIDESEDWINITKARIPESLLPYITFHHNRVSLGTFSDRPVTYYHDLPNQAYDLIYVDGPSQYSHSEPDCLGFSTANPGRMPMSADILRIEHYLQPGTLVLFDGRVANAKFFEVNTQKKWRKLHSSTHDQTLFIEESESLGKFNRAFLHFWGRISF